MPSLSLSPAAPDGWNLWCLCGGNVGSNENSLHKLFFKKSETAFFAFLAKTLINSDKTTFPSSRREIPARLGFQVCATTPGL